MRLLAALAVLAAVGPAARAASPVAGAFVESDEWINRRGKEREEEFQGHVRYASGGTRLTADWARFKHAARTWDAKGHVELRRTLDDGALVEAHGETARFDQGTGRGSLDPKPGERVSFSRAPAPAAGVAPEPDRGVGGRLTWNGEQEAVLSGGARVWGPRLEAAADEAAYARRERKLTLNGGRPVLRKVEGEWTTALKADRVVAYDSPRLVTAEGKVRGWLQFRDEKKLKELAK